MNTKNLARWNTPYPRYKIVIVIISVKTSFKNTVERILLYTVPKFQATALCCSSFEYIIPWHSWYSWWSGVLGVIAV
jgi:hypothetical protein